jgi:hypothetical protein
MTDTPDASVHELGDDYGFTARHVRRVAERLDRLCPSWSELVNPGRFREHEIGTSALGQVRDALVGRDDPSGREVAEMLWSEYPMHEHWDLWHAAWQNETLRRRRTD